MYCNLLLFTCYEYTSTGRKALEMRFIVSRTPLSSGCPLTFSIRGARQLFVFVTLDNAIHIICPWCSSVSWSTASCASYSADLDKKRATSHASYIADTDKETFPPMHMQTKAFLVLTGVQIETYIPCIILKRILSQHLPCTTDIYTYTFVSTSPQKTPQNKL